MANAIDDLRYISRYGYEDPWSKAFEKFNDNLFDMIESKMTMDFKKMQLEEDKKDREYKRQRDEKSDFLDMLNIIGDDPESIKILTDPNSNYMYNSPTHIKNSEEVEFINRAASIKVEKNNRVQSDLDFIRNSANDMYDRYERASYMMTDADFENQWPIIQRQLDSINNEIQGNQSWDYLRFVWDNNISNNPNFVDNNNNLENQFNKSIGEEYSFRSDLNTGRNLYTIALGKISSKTTNRNHIVDAYRHELDSAIKAIESGLGDGWNGEIDIGKIRGTLKNKYGPLLGHHWNPNLDMEQMILNATIGGTVQSESQEDDSKLMSEWKNMTQEQKNTMGVSTFEEFKSFSTTPAAEEEEYTIEPFLKARNLVERMWHESPERIGEWKYPSSAIVKTSEGYISGAQANSLKLSGKDGIIIKDASSGIPFKWSGGTGLGERSALRYEGMAENRMRRLKDGDVVYDKETGETGQVKIHKLGKDTRKKNTKVEVNGEEYEVDTFMKRFILSIFLESKVTDYSPFKTGNKSPE